jgi:hypothetical protein
MSRLILHLNKQTEAQSPTEQVIRQLVGAVNIVLGNRYKPKKKRLDFKTDLRKIIHFHYTTFNNVDKNEKEKAEWERYKKHIDLLNEIELLRELLDWRNTGIYQQHKKETKK